jgi:hypothetical protein
MKINRASLPVLSIVVAFAALAPAPAFAKDAGGTLTMAAAHDAARPLAWKVVRRNPSVNSVKVQGCHRRTDDRAVCQAVARGSSSELKTSCSIWVRVQLVHGRPKASLKEVSCANERFALLRAARALAAMRPVAEEIGGKDVLFSTAGRRSRVEILALASWLRPSADDPAVDEICSAVLQARLLDTGEVTVTVGEIHCFTPH